jgi:DNA-binding MarR family transcriptional regulator
MPPSGQGDQAFPAHAQTLGYLLRELYEALQQGVYAAVAAEGHPGVRELHSPLLRHLPAEGARVADLARRCGLAKQSVAYVVDDLTRLGYVTVAPDPEDGRAKRVKLTSRGGELIRSLLAHSAAAEAALAERVGAHRLAALRATLEDAVRPVGNVAGDR